MLLVLFGVFWLALAVEPRYRQDWLLENALVFALVPLLAFTVRKFRFSNTSYTLLFVFLCLHEIGAHYTYAEVPYDEAFRALTGQSLDAWFDFRRNHYDRLVHFLSGLLLLPVVAELLRARTVMRGVWAAVLPVAFILAQSALFELIEWAAAVVFGGDLGQAYLGTQGDEWDAQSDMALALLGALIAQGLCGACARYRRRV
jgi:putative membrane protein